MEPRSARILVVDDDPSILEMLEEVLRAEGIAVTTAAGGRAGLTALDSTTPDLVVLDVRMPGIDGLEFASQMRARGYTARILVVTADQDAPRLAAQIGGDDYLRKPFDVEDLLSAIGRLLRSDDGR